jgi:hypothetical protein
MKRSGESRGFAVLTEKKLYFRTTRGYPHEDRIPLHQISNIENEGTGRYLINWVKLDKHGNPRADKLGNYKEHRARFQLLKNKLEAQFNYFERREQFGYFLRKAIKNLQGKKFLIMY